MTHAERDQSEDRRRITRTRFGSWECPTCHARDTFSHNGDGDTATCDNCRRIADLPTRLSLSMLGKIHRVGPHIDPDISAEDAAELMKAYDHTLDPGKLDPAAPDTDRVNTYAETIWRLWLTTTDGGTYSVEDIARAVIVLADREQATLLAKIAELTAERMRLQRAESAWTGDLEAQLADERAKVAELTAEVERLHQRLADSERTITELSGRLRRRERALADEQAKAAQAWDEGAKAVQGRLATFGSAPAMPANPYRAALAGPDEPEASETGVDA